jgi:hypothetical protein
VTAVPAVARQTETEDCDLALIRTQVDPHLRHRTERSSTPGHSAADRTVPAGCYLSGVLTLKDLRPKINERRSSVDRYFDDGSVTELLERIRVPEREAALARYLNCRCDEVVIFDAGNIAAEDSAQSSSPWLAWWVHDSLIGSRSSQNTVPAGGVGVGVGEGDGVGVGVGGGVGVGVGDGGGVGVGVGVGGAPFEYSKAPISVTAEPLESPSTGRFVPVMSVCAECALVPASIAGDPPVSSKLESKGLARSGSDSIECVSHVPPL